MNFTIFGFISAVNPRNTLSAPFHYGIPLNIKENKKKINIVRFLIPAELIQSLPEHSDSPPKNVHEP